METHPDDLTNQNRASSLCLLLPDCPPGSGLKWEVVGRLVADMVREKAGRLGIMVTQTLNIHAFRYGT